MSLPFPPRSAHAAARLPRASHLSAPLLAAVRGAALLAQLALLTLTAPLCFAANTGGNALQDPYSPSVNAYIGQSVTNGNVGIDTSFLGNIYGGYSSSANVSDNTVNISGGTVSGAVSGGSSLAGSAERNTVTLHSGQVTDYIFGGYIPAGTGTAEGNTVNINGGTVNSVYGGAALASNALSNTVNINGGTVNTDVFGAIIIAAADDAIASLNMVNMTAGTVTGSIYGGSVDSGGGSASENTVTITGGAAANVYGGSTATGNAVNNLVSIHGNLVTSNVYGGHVTSGSGNAEDNAVFISNGHMNHVYGAYLFRGNGYAMGNSVNISGGTTGLIYGAYVNSGDATFNTVNISASSAPMTGLDVFGGHVNAASGNAANNTVTINGGTVSMVYGGSAVGGNAMDNTVTINGGTVGSVTGGSVINGSAIGNTVNIAGGTVNGNVYGGYTSTGHATGNTVNISGGTVLGDVRAGLSRSGDSSNTVRIFGNPVFGANTRLWGGTNSGMAPGNSLEIATKGITVAGLDSFQNLSFYLPPTIAPNDTVLTVTGAGGVDIRGAAVGVGIMGGGTPLAKGDSVTLIKATGAGGLTADPTIPNITGGMQGISTEYAFKLGVTGGNALSATVDSVSSSHEGIRKSPSEGQAAGAATLTQGADLAGGQGMVSAGQAASAASAGGEAQSGWGGFGSTSGGMSTYATGSHVDSRGASLMLGLAKRFSLDGADLVAGPFFEAGVSSYDSYNDGPGGSDSIHAWGDSNYQGGGLLARLEATQGMLKGLYAEASARAGSLHTTYRSDDLNPALGRASYQTTSGYMGAHAGLGYVWELDATTDLDVYTKYFWTRTEGSSVTVLGDDLDFDAVDSQRLRAGARLSRDFTPTIRPYIGAAWEHEFDGAARSVVAGIDAPAPSLKGDTGMAEAGITWKPHPDSDFSLDIGALGYTGKREGIGGNLALRFEF